MTADWTETTLGNFIELKRGYDLPKRERTIGAYPLISSSGQSDWHDVAKAKGPGVVTGRYGTIGQVFYIEDDFWPLNTTLYVRDFKDSYPRFVYYFLKTLLWEKFNDKSGVPGVNRNDAHREPIVVPHVIEQQAIAETLGALDDKIEVNQRMNRTLEAMARAVFRDWFVDFGPTRRQMAGVSNPHAILGGLIQNPKEAHRLAALFPAALGDNGLPEGWTIGKIESIARKIAMGPFGSRITKDNFVEKGVPVVRGKNLGNGFVDSDFVYVTPEKATELSNSIAEQGDIVLTHRGTLGQVARIYPEANFERYVVSQSQILLSVDKAKASPLAVYHFLLSQEGQFEWLSNSGGAGVPAIARPTSSLKQIEMTLPDASVSREYETLARVLEAKIVAGIKQNRTLAATRDLLLPKFMSGEIRLKNGDRSNA